MPCTASKPAFASCFAPELDELIKSPGAGPRSASFHDIPMPKWCQKEQAEMLGAGEAQMLGTGCGTEQLTIPKGRGAPMHKEITDKLQENILDLLTFYLGSQAKSHSAKPGLDDINDPRAKEQQWNTTAYGISGLEPLPRIHEGESKLHSPTCPHLSLALSLHEKSMATSPHMQMSKGCSPMPMGPTAAKPRSTGVQDMTTVTSEDPNIQHARSIAMAGGGLGGYMTIMIQQIPYQYSQQQLMNEIVESGFGGTFDFFYLPANAKNHGSRGFGFINFLSASHAEKFYRQYHGGKFKEYETVKTMAVIPADVQGFEQSALSFFSSWRLRNKKHHHEPVFLKPVPAYFKEKGRRIEKSSVCKQKPVLRLETSVSPDSLCHTLCF